MDEQSWPVLEGQRCRLVVLAPGDAAAWKAGEDEEQLRWFHFPGPAPIDNVVRAIAEWRRHWHEDGLVRQWGIWLEARLAGGVEIRDRGDGLGSLSYVVFPEYRRMGLALEAIRLSTQWAFVDMSVDGVVAVVDERNSASRAVVERLGFHLDGAAEPWEYGEPGPSVRYVLRQT